MDGGGLRCARGAAAVCGGATLMHAADALSPAKWVESRVVDRAAQTGDQVIARPGGAVVAAAPVAAAGDVAQVRRTTGVDGVVTGQRGLASSRAGGEDAGPVG